MKLVATTFQGLETVLAEELKILGATKVTPKIRAVEFEGDLRLLYRANYELRTAIRVLKPMYAFKTKHENHLYKKVQEHDWTQLIGLDDTFAVNAATASKYLTHSKYLSLKVKDAIVDQLRDFYEGRRPSIDTSDPTFRINVHLAKDNVCTIAMDSSGTSLHKRGYRRQSVPAPINEVLAAGMILMTGWKGDQTLIDPMCGSGTLLIEAAMIARNIPPQNNRDYFGFMAWEDFDEDLWFDVREEADQKIKKNEYAIIGGDVELNAFEAAETNVISADLENTITLNWGAFERMQRPAERGIIVMNPPYDLRLEEADIVALYQEIGNTLKHNFSGYDAWILSANREAMKFIGLRPSKKIILFNAALECRFQKYELYRGSKKAKKQENV